MNAQKPALLHYFLVAGTVEYTVPSDHGPVTRSLPVSGVFCSDDRRLTGKALSDLQLKLQHQFVQHYRQANPTSTELNISYAMLSGISWLGQMTEEEFLAMPPEPEQKPEQ